MHPVNGDRSILDALEAMTWPEGAPRFPEREDPEQRSPDDDERDFSRAAELLRPRSKVGPLFGVTSRDITSAARRLETRLAGTEAQQRAKRVFDIGFSLFSLLLLSPMLLVTALAIKFESPGPVMFRQTRVGRGGGEFPMLKFRTMVVDAEDRLADMLKSAKGSDSVLRFERDPRITKIGHFLRRHSIDELPQLINVIRGEMSLVGPRPPLPYEVAQYSTQARRRLLVKPGLTGLWQVSGRADLAWEDAVRLDLRYVENWSLTLDLAIVWRTVRFALGGYASAPASPQA